MQREAQALRPSRFLITTGNEQLPHVLSDAALNAPAMAPSVSASPVMSASATSSAPPKSSVVHDRPLLTDASSATSAGSKFRGLAPIIPDGSNSGQLDRPWLGMWLLVIALLASNTYVGWLFWDARQRYRGLLAQTFSFGQQAAEA
ncbi:MAG: hypothetical protein ABSG53_33920 [Thermoguttaceae bacterium]